MKLEERFKIVPVEIQVSSGVSFECYEHTEENIIWVKLSGVCEPESGYGKYFYQHLGLVLLKFQPNAVLVDLRELGYNYGAPITGIFEVFNEVRIFGDDTVLRAFVLSSTNKFAFATLLNFDAERPEPPLFLDVNLAYDYLYAEYDKI